jgi:hypothetical protein
MKKKVYDNPIVTEVSPLTVFYTAEDYHQDYYENNMNEPYCRMVIQPNWKNLKKIFADKLKMNNPHSNNPHYSRTDTTVLEVSNKEWKKILPADFMQLPAKPIPKEHLPVNTGIQKAKALIIVPCVAINYFVPMQNLPAPAAGPASLKHQDLIVFCINPIILMVWTEQKYCVQDAARTWVIFLTMARLLLISVFV